MIKKWNSFVIYYLTIPHVIIQLIRTVTMYPFASLKRNINVQKSWMINIKVPVHSVFLIVFILYCYDG